MGELVHANAAELERLKGSKEYADVIHRYSDRNWRMDNLYKIVDETGRIIPFKRNAAQRHYMARRHSRDVIPKARKLGFSTLIDLLILDYSMFRRNVTSGIIDKTKEDAKKKLATIDTAYRQMPQDLQDANPMVISNTERIEWANGSNVSAGTSFVGGTPQILHVSEFGLVSVNTPDAARQIKAGSFRAVPTTGWIPVESTCHGTSGEFFDMVEAAKRKQATGQPLTVLDFKLHFYGWFMKPEYRLPNNLVVLTQENIEYFQRINAILQERVGVTLDADQMAWYAQQLGDLGPDDMFEQYPTILEEAFFNSVQGAFFKKELSRARAEKRIGFPVPHDPSRRVNTWWDIGEDGTAIIFAQGDGVHTRAIDYHEEEGGSLQSAAAVLDQKQRERKFIYGKHIGPHDMDQRVWAAGAKTKRELASDLGITFEVVPQVDDKSTSIEAARRLLGMMWFDEVHCKLLVDRLDNYRKKWNRALQVFSPVPVHDESSHPADALQQGAMYDPGDDGKPDRGKRPGPKKRSPWAS